MRTQQLSRWHTSADPIPAAHTSVPVTDPSAAVTAPGRGGRPSGAICLTRRGRLVFLGLPVVVALAAIAGALVWLLGGLTNQTQASTVGQPGVEAVEVTVSPGDSLWSVASEVESPAETQEVISRIAELNNLDSSELQPGQTLHVPMD